MAINIAPDKWKHFFAGIVMGAVLQITAITFLPFTVIVATLIVFAIVVSVSYGFELYSKFTGHGHYDFMDAVPSVAGGVLGMAIIFLFQ